jgi:hypothetical protein
VGKHSAGDDATVHPLVADALARRAGVPGAAHDADAPGRGGSTGWPGPEREGGGAVGWPDESRPTRSSTAQSSTAPSRAPRRGWRRLFGAPAA